MYSLYIQVTVEGGQIIKEYTVLGHICGLAQKWLAIEEFFARKTAPKGQQQCLTLGFITYVAEDIHKTKRKK
jgi:hypothetical protein